MRDYFVKHNFILHQNAGGFYSSDALLSERTLPNIPVLKQEWMAQARSTLRADVVVAERAARLEVQHPGVRVAPGGIGSVRPWKHDFNWHNHDFNSLPLSQREFILNNL